MTIFGNLKWWSKHHIGQHILIKYLWRANNSTNKTAYQDVQFKNSRQSMYLHISLAHSALILALRYLQLLSGRNNYHFRHHFANWAAIVPLKPPLNAWFTTKEALTTPRRYKGSSNFHANTAFEICSDASCSVDYYPPWFLSAFPVSLLFLSKLGDAMARPMLQISYLYLSPLTLPFFPLVIAQGNSKKSFLQVYSRSLHLPRKEKRAVRVEINKKRDKERHKERR